MDYSLLHSSHHYHWTTLVCAILICAILICVMKIKESHAASSLGPSPCVQMDNLANRETVREYPQSVKLCMMFHPTNGIRFDELKPQQEIIY
jgi:hypothetical protein